MITTVTLNAAVDKIYTVAGFGLNAVHRIEGGLTVPGGKGVNAARVIRTLGEPVRATGFVAGHTGRLLTDGLSAEGVSVDFIEAAHGETRLAITVLDPSAHTQTELIESGPTIGPLELAALRRKITTLAADSAWVVFSGSLPPGCPPDLYAELCTLAKARGARVALD
ncbi:PfkB family carbohydrate kinase, partial [Paenibacillus kribbensis]